MVSVYLRQSFLSKGAQVRPGGRRDEWLVLGPLAAGLHGPPGRKAVAVRAGPQKNARRGGNLFGDHTAKKGLKLKASPIDEKNTISPPF
jgi:hypothetical protein